MDHYYQGIPGWFDFQDIYSEAIQKAPEGGTIVEIGCWQGQSLSYLLVEAKNSGKNLKIFGVDHFQGGVGEGHHQEVLSRINVAEECQRNCKKSGYPFELLKMPSVDAARQFGGRSIDFVFIDGSHDYLSVRNDIKAWLKKVKVNGVIGGHDYLGAFPGVQLGVRDHIPFWSIKNRGASWLWENMVPYFGEWSSFADLTSSEPVAPVFVPYVNNFSLLTMALESIPEGWPVVVIDQSQDGLKGTNRANTFIYRWKKDLHFSLVMNWIQTVSRILGMDRYFFLHSDAEVAEGGLERMNLMMDEIKHSGKRIGIIYTHYDALCLVNMDAVYDVGCWDETFQWYFADIDYYNRFKREGWGHIDFPQALACHHGSQTLKSLPPDKREYFRKNSEWAEKHYENKWGCKASEGTRYGVPYNGILT